MLATIEAFMAAHRLTDVTIVAAAGMISNTNQKAIEKVGLSFVLGLRIPDVASVVAGWHRQHPDTKIEDGHVFVQPWPAGHTDNRA